MLFSPTIGCALKARHWFLWVCCPACRTTQAVDLRTLDRHPWSAISSLIPALSAPKMRRVCSSRNSSATLLSERRTSSAKGACGLHSPGTTALDEAADRGPWVAIYRRCCMALFVSQPSRRRMKPFTPGLASATQPVAYHEVGAAFGNHDDRRIDHATDQIGHDLRHGKPFTTRGQSSAWPYGIRSAPTVSLPDLD